MNGIMAWLQKKKKLEWILPLGFLLAILFVYASLFGEEKASAGTREEELEQILTEITGTDSVSVMIHEDQDEKIVGVIVAAQGAENAQTRLCLYQAVTTVLQISADQVEILPMKENQP